MRTFFTSESVSEGHPDKVCDQIADAILDAHLSQDPNAHVACEVTATVDRLHIMGEVTSRASVDYDAIARKQIRRIGYTIPGIGFDADSCQITVDVHDQSPDIAMGVTKASEEENGAGDQGMMFGYACTETESYMPLAIALSHKMLKRLAQARKKGEIKGLLPDSKGQITVEYEDGRPVHIDTVVLSTQHKEEVNLNQLKMELVNKVLKDVLPSNLFDEKTKIFINPTGRFVIGGPAGDTGLTGRKIIVDTYGGYARHGGGSFSGKDPSKVDRSAAYMARYLAKNIVACGYADACEVQLSYAIGVAEPVSIHVETFGSGKLMEEEIIREIEKREDLTPTGIIKKFDLKRPIYLQTACYGHFGENTASLPWEKVSWK
ncbi:methionine adenosyltransferase [Kallipyga massiliensis]|uniref:methionine adenosyltransferase n=1 Tax=Kallipyga massiliensis TaxID=1472764 RepID=UPI0026EAB364|nr:methionine adenosyltransferase [Kallipyga massiliensis]